MSIFKNKKFILNIVCILGIFFFIGCDFLSDQNTDSNNDSGGTTTTQPVNTDTDKTEETDTTQKQITRTVNISSCTVSGNTVYISYSLSTSDSSSASDYVIHYSTNSDFSSEITKKVGNTASSLTIGDLNANTTYYLKVVAENSNWESSIESEVQSVAVGNIGANKGIYQKVESNTLNLTGLDNNLIYLVNMNPSNYTISANSTRGVSNISDTITANLRSAYSEYLDTQFDEKEIYNVSTSDYPIREEFLPAQEFNSNPPAIGQMYQNFKMMKSGGQNPYTVNETVQSFWINTATNKWVQKSATLRSIGTYCYVWVVDENFDDTSSSETDNKVNSNQMQLLAEKYDLLYPYETNLFGAKYSGAGSSGGLIAYKDKVSILIYDIYEDYAENQESGVVGYFWGKDFYEDGTADLGNLRSNENEMFYIDSLFLDKYKNMTYSTLAHEFQHMLHFVNKKIEKDLDSSTWFNEMLSMLCEDILQDKIGLTDEESPKKRLTLFNMAYMSSGIKEWLSDDALYLSYSNAYAFGAYLLRNYGGPQLLKAMADNDYIDAESITAALVAVGYTNETFETVFEKYPQALIYLSTSEAENHLSFNKSCSATINSEQYNLSAIDLSDYPGILNLDNSNYFAYYSPTKFPNNNLYQLRPWDFTIKYIGCYSGNKTLTISNTSGSYNDSVYVLVK